MWKGSDILMKKKAAKRYPDLKITLSLFDFAQNDIEHTL
jgi:hypothetical protein